MPTAGVRVLAPIAVVTLVSRLLLVPVVHGLDNGLALTPPMGWRSWNCFQGDVTQAVIEAVVDAMVDRSRVIMGGKHASLADVGYVHVGVDDGWQACGTGWDKSFHAQDGTPLVNETKFTDLKSMVAYGHSKNLRMGWYDDNCICMDSYLLRANTSWAERSYIGDVDQLLNAKFDGVKIDNCGDDDGSGFSSRVKHINASGTPLIIENSNQAHGHGPPRGLPIDPEGWCNFNLFRSGGDIGPSFDNVMGKLQTTLPFLGNTTSKPISRPGCWAYPDMLEVGNFGWTSEVDALATFGSESDAMARVRAANDLAVIESRSHFGAWCIVSSPLTIGMDVTNQEQLDSVWHILTNEEAIAVNQAWNGSPGRLVREEEEYQIWAKLLNHGEAVLVINRSNEAIDVTVTLQELGLPPECSGRDVWNSKDIVVSSHWKVSGLGKHDSAFVTLAAV